MPSPFSISVAAALLAFALLPAAQAQTNLYWGPSGSGVPTGGTGTWNTSSAFWSTDTLGTTYTTWQAGSIANMGNTTGTVTIGANLDVGGINFGTTALTIQGDSAGREITLSGSSPVINTPASVNSTFYSATAANALKILGTGGFTKTGPGTLRFLDNIVHTLSGTVDNQLGSVLLWAAKFTSVNEWNLAPLRDENVNMNSSFITSTLELGTGVSTSRLGATSTIKLRGAGMLTQSGTSAGTTDSFGTLDVQNSLGQIIANTNTATLTINNAFDRGTRGTINFQNLDNASADVTIADAATGRPADGVTLPWAINTGSGASTDKNRFVKFDHATDSFALVASTAVADSNLATWTYNSTALDLHMDVGTGGEAAFSGLLGSNQTLNTLMIGRANADAGTFNLGGRTLFVNALALNNTVTVSNGTVSGNGGSQLYIHTGPQIVNLSSAFSAQIGGTNDVILSTAQPDFRYGGFTGTTDNTYIGTMYINGFGTRFAGAGKKVTGNLVIGESTTLRLGASNQIDDGGVVDIGARGMLHLGGEFESLAVSETVKGITGTGTVDLGAGTNIRSLTVNTAGSSYTFDGRIAGGSTDSASAVTKAGLGTWTLTGANAYDQNTVVSGGTLLINGSHVNPTAGRGYTVNSGGILGGNGSITLNAGNVTIANDGTLAPGTSPGTLTLNTDLVLSGTDSKVVMEIDGTAPGTYDRVVGINAFTMNGDLTFDLTGTYTTGTWDVFDFVSKSGNFDSVTLTGSYTGSFTRDGDLWTGNAGIEDWSFNQLDGILTVVPEPNTVAMMIGGLGTLLLLRRRRR